MDRVEKKACRLCNIEASFYTDGNGEKTWERHESSLLLAQAPWTSLRACRYKDGRLALYGVGDNETNLYFPNFCPECGKPNKEAPVRCLCRTCVNEGCDHGYCIGCFECVEEPVEQRHDVYICTGHEELKEEE